MKLPPDHLTSATPFGPLQPVGRAGVAERVVRAEHQELAADGRSAPQVGVPWPNDRSRPPFAIAIVGRGAWFCMMPGARSVTCRI